MSCVLNDVLLLQKIESADLLLDLQPFNLHQWLSTQISLHRYLANTAGVSLNLCFPQGLGAERGAKPGPSNLVEEGAPEPMATVVADQSRLAQALSNAISNGRVD